jgi:hypothetical protein
VMAWLRKQRLSNIVVEVSHACPKVPNGWQEAARALTFASRCGSFPFGQRPVSFHQWRAAQCHFYQTCRINLKVLSRRSMRRHLTLDKGPQAEGQGVPGPRLLYGKRRRPKRRPPQREMFRRITCTAARWCMLSFTTISRQTSYSLPRRRRKWWLLAPLVAW